MKSRISVVTIDDIDSYFKSEKGSTEHWNVRVRPSGNISCESEMWTIDLEPSIGPLFNVKIYAYDDPSDSDEETTDDPVEFVDKFIKEGMPRVSSSINPNELSKYLQYLSDMVRNKRIGSTNLMKSLRRVSVSSNIGNTLSIISSIIRKIGSEYKNKEIKEVFNELSDRGWDVDLGKDRMSININDLFEVNIELNSIIWSYVFYRNDIYDYKKEGTTEDPIGEFEKYKREVRNTSLIPDTLKEGELISKWPGKSNYNIPDAKSFEIPYYS